MEIYLVGGAVRDRLMAAAQGQAQAAGDRDWVVVGATPEDMIKAGFTPVGRDFPVFLHPRSHEEYALARTERKRAPGYHGFVFRASPEVTLEDDLARRDLTINAMALDNRERLVDLHGGARDLSDKVLRHVSPAFAEDPVRILRLARFAARWPDFRVHEATMTLCRAMVAAGEVDALVAERVWQELARGLMEVRPSRLFAVLRDAGALARLLPEVDRLFGVPQTDADDPGVVHDSGEMLLRTLDAAAGQRLPLAVRYAAIGLEIGKGATPEADWPAHPGHGRVGAALMGPLSQRLRVPAALRELAEMVAREQAEVQRALQLDAGAVLRLLQRCDAWRRPERFGELLQACECALRARRGPLVACPPRERLGAALAATQAVDSRAVTQQARAQGLVGPAIAAALAAAREQALVALGWPVAAEAETVPESVT
jgi:tRNA nucleotidyltransferase (CCA-adding enzyme)